MVAAALLAVGALNLIRLLNGRAASATTETIVYGIVLGLALAGAFFWMFYRPGRKLYCAMVEANRNLQVLPVYSSDDLISGMKELNGSRLASSGLPSGAYLVFVDAGRQFELWRSHRGRPERVIRLPWATVQSIDIGTISHLVIVDRALVLTVKSGERSVRIPVSPQECHAVRLTPVKAEVFNKLLTQLQSRVATNQLGADPRRPNSTVKPSSETI